VTHAPEGWYTDPYARHQQRWMSDGTPTSLVRDDGTTARDEPPSGPYVHEPEPIDEPPAADGADLRRADEAESVDMSVSPGDSVRAVLNDPYGAGPLLGAGEPD
jgi:hypothetical protein